MASSYGPLSLWYDTLTGDIPYGEFADFYEARFNIDGGEFKTLLDLCCGTGTLTALMAHRGYEMIAVDASADMLMQASGKASDAEIAPLYLCQDACELDLYGTVDAAYCSLDGINYISPDKLGRVFDRLHLFVRPYGLFIFDIKTPESGRNRRRALPLARGFLRGGQHASIRNGSVLPARQAVAARMRGAH